MPRIDGVAVAAIGAGGLLCYAGIKGYSIPATAQSIIQGKSPANQALANPISTPVASTTAGGGGSAGTAPSSGSETSFFTAMLQDLGAPATSANLMSCYAWARKEEPGFPPQNVGGNAWNPLNIKNPATGGFAQYASAADGASGTAEFILSEGYPNILAAFQSGKGLCGNSSLAAELSAWSGGGYSSVC